jgi:asparagine synthase (glutamine-hydrolysing)
MCGIAGIWPTRQDDEGAARFVALALEEMKTRGPDGAQQSFYKGAWLVHRRLAIQDLSDAAAQPMFSPDKRYSIVFNGEIYNHWNLRRKHLGHVDFITTSDTETLLHLLIGLGVENALPLLHGMFAFGFYDAVANTLILARDPFGEKPLAYQCTGFQLRFCSTLQPFRDTTGDSVDPNALLSYLSFGYVNGAQSILENVQKVKPGTFVRFTADRVNQNLSKAEFVFFLPGQGNATSSDIKLDRNHLISAIENSVREQLISDVPIGCFLSGGIDSSLIAALMQKHSSSPINTFTIGFSDIEFNESHHAEEIARYIGSVHHTQIVSEQELLDSVLDITRAYDEPFSDPSMLPTMQLCRFAREHVTVCLSGDGADELFGGYMKYQRAHMLPYTSLLRLFQKTFDYIYRNDWISHHRANKAMAVMSSKDGQSLNAAMMMLNAIPKSFLETELVRGLDQPTPPKLAFSNASHLRQMMQSDQLNYLPDDILVKVDRAAMAYSLEVRAPFLATTVFEASLELSDRQLISNGVNKKELREILYGLVPRALVDRPKQGFSVPIGKWMQGPLKEWGNELVKCHTPYLSRERMKRDWDCLQRGDLSSAGRMWSLLMFAAWYHKVTI